MRLNIASTPNSRTSIGLSSNTSIQSSHSNEASSLYDIYKDDVELPYHNAPYAHYDVIVKVTRHKVHVDYFQDDQNLETIDRYEFVNHIVRFVPWDPYSFWHHPLDSSFHRVSPGTLTLYMGCKWCYSGKIEGINSLKSVFNVIRAISLAEDYFHESHINRYRCHECRTWMKNKEKVVMCKMRNILHKPPLSCQAGPNSNGINSLNILHQNTTIAIPVNNSMNTPTRPPEYDSMDFNC